jgi:hypothetical protein
MRENKSARTFSVFRRETRSTLRRLDPSGAFRNFAD